MVILGDFVNRDNFRHFVGLGVRLIYKRAFDAILRLDYGIDIYNSGQRGFVFGFGQYFLMYLFRDHQISLFAGLFSHSIL